MGEDAELDKHKVQMDRETTHTTKEAERLSTAASEGFRLLEIVDSGENNGTKRESTANGVREEGIAVFDPAQKMTAKFLMSNTAAGSIIGKGGANINELQRKSGAKLQLSRPSEFFPGTNDRVLSGTGSIHQLGTALDLILTACQDDASQKSNGTSEDHDDTELKFLAPSAVCGVLIGKAGINIKGYAKESNASITVSSVHEQLPGVSDRVVTINGQIHEVVKAFCLILERLQDSRHYNRLANVAINYQSWGVSWGGQRVPMNGLPGGMPMMGPQLGTGPQAETELCLQIPDACIGAIIGKGGEIITQIKNLFDVTIRISDRDHFVPGTRNREIAIRGAPHRVHLANQLIHEKLCAAESPAGPSLARRRQ